MESEYHPTRDKKHLLYPHLWLCGERVIGSTRLGEEELGADFGEMIDEELIKFGWDEDVWYVLGAIFLCRDYNTYILWG